MISVPNLLQRSSGNRRRLPAFFLIAAVGLSSCSKKIFSNKGKDREKEPEEEVVTEPEVVEDKGIFKREAPVISLMLPFRLDQVNPVSARSLESLRQSELALDFYQGFRMGLDSLSQKGASFKLQVYDTRDEVTTISRLIMSPELSGSSLIVGPVFPSGMNVVSRFSQSKQVYFVSPLAPRIAVEGNAFQIVATAPMEMHTERAAGFVAEELRASQVLVISSAEAEESSYIRSFMKSMKEKAPSVAVREIDVGSYGSNISVLKDHLSESRVNTLVVPSISSTFWQILFSYLDMLPDTYRYTIIAHPGFMNVKNLDLGKAGKYHVYTTSSGAAAPTAKDRANDFYKSYFSKYKVAPSEYASKGFDLAMYFGAALWNDRSELDKALEKRYSGYRNEFDFVRTPNGFINRGVKVLKVQDYEFVEQ